MDALGEGVQALEGGCLVGQALAGMMVIALSVLFLVSRQRLTVRRG